MDESKRTLFGQGPGSAPVEALCPVCKSANTDGALCRGCAESAVGLGGTKGPAGPTEPVLLAGKYRLLEEIGRGGMGTVFRARDTSLERTVAVKFILPELKADPRLEKRFVREARALASVKHPGVVRIYELGRFESVPFFVMEHVEGPTGDEWLDGNLARGRLPSLARVLKILEQAAAGLSAVHAAGVVHRDVKPGNLILEESTDRVVLMDFGLGKRFELDDSRRTISVGGTPAYMAPETLVGREISAAEELQADIYSLGVTAFELLTGYLPFSGKNVVAAIRAKLAQRAPHLSSKRRDVPERLDQLVASCMAQEGSDRPQSGDAIAREVASILADLDSSETPRAPTPTPPRLHTLNRVPGRGARIVVADPDVSFRAALYEAAREALPGSSVRAARSNLVALDLIERTQPSVVVAPLDEPSLNGLELAAMLTETGHIDDMGVVLTAEGISAADRAVLDGMGICRLLMKPASDEVLREILLDCAGPAPVCGLSDEEAGPEDDDPLSAA